jgi:ABC-type phosphate/phosphonate transport system substrate-binding protein
MIPAENAPGQSGKLTVLRVGSTGNLTGKTDSSQEKAGAETLRSFIKEETGLDNEIIGQQPWREVADKLAKGQIDLGVFQGYEYAWAQERNPEVKPLAVGINRYRYPVACVLTKRDNPAMGFSDLKGQALILPISGQTCLRLFVERSCEASHQKPAAFFSKITFADNVEDALDDIVDGGGQAIVIDQAGLDAYKQRKPGRFKQLKEVARSQPFPPIVVAYCGSALDENTRGKFKDALLNADRKEKGEMLLTLSRLSAFEAVPEDFAKVLEATRKRYPKED